MEKSKNNYEIQSNIHDLFCLSIKEAGITLCIDRKMQSIISADNPASAFLGGFKQSVTVQQHFGTVDIAWELMMKYKTRFDYIMY